MLRTVASVGLLAAFTTSAAGANANEPERNADAQQRIGTVDAQQRMGQVDVQQRGQDVDARERKEKVDAQQRKEKVDAQQRVGASLSSATTLHCPTDGAGLAFQRVLVFTHGFEHVSSDVALQWFGSGESGPRLLRSVEVRELGGGMWSVGAPVANEHDCSFRIVASHTYSTENAVFVVTPGTAGRYTVRRTSAR